jgi:hypothetical protein
MKKSDVYSFGLTLWAILTRSDPFPEMTSFSVFKRAITKDHKRPPIPACPPSLRILMERCWDKEADQRPSFTQIIPMLDEVIIDSAIADETGRTLWKSNFMGKTKIPFQQFLPVYANHLGIDLGVTEPDSEEYMCLETCITAPNTDVVEMEQFGLALSFFGPLEPKGFMERIVSTHKRTDFFGAISKVESEQKLQKERKKSYLVRLSNTQPGTFVISKASGDVITHQRVTYSPGKGFIVQLVDSKNKQPIKETFKDWNSVVRKLKLENPCTGHPFGHIFVKKDKAKVAVGYLDDEL